MATINIYLAHYNILRMLHLELVETDIEFLLLRLELILVETPLKYKDLELSTPIFG